MTELLASIEEFAGLSMLRLKGELPLEERQRLEVLEDLLRDNIEGAHPAPRRIENPSAAAPARSSFGVKPAQVVVNKRPPPGQGSAEDVTLGPGAAVVIGPATKTSAPPASSVAALADRLELNPKDRDKLTEMRSTDIPRSAYTPSSAPPYLEDYYRSDLDLTADLLDTPPARAISAEGEASELGKEAKLMFGLTQPPPPSRSSAPSGRASSPGSAPRGGSTTVASDAPPRPSGSTRAPAREASAASGPPAVVHLLSGSSRRGDLLTFAPDAGQIVLRLASGEEELMPFDDIFAIFVGIPRGATAAVPSGTRMIVKLLNERELVGHSPDYAPGAAAMTLVPDDRRTVDRVWIPAWSVTEIRFA